MKAHGHDGAGVRAHYAELAATYDQRANKACKRAYESLVRRALGGCGRVLEIGAGSSPLLGVLPAPFSVACDLSWSMLSARNAAPDASRAVADGCSLPFCSEAFDAVVSINVLEHVPDPARFVAETARILAPGGLLLAVTPNGDVSWLLDLLERLHLKLPEGPHCFLTRDGLAALAGTSLEIVEQSRFLAFPAGPDALVRLFDGFGRPEGGRGLFQYIVLRKYG